MAFLNVQYFKGILILLLIACCKNVAGSQSISDNLIPSAKESTLFEIGKVEVEGNLFFSDSEIKSLIPSRATNRSWSHRILQYYSEQIQMNSASDYVLPPYTISTLNTVLERMEYEIQYFEKLKAEIDLESITNLYFQNGFHDVEVTYEFFPDYKTMLNILKFNIIENKQYTIKSINYLNLDSIDSETKRLIEINKQIQVNEYYKLGKLDNEVIIIQSILLNNGYFYSHFDSPIISIDSVNKTDSITVEFFPGKRQKIASITFIDSTKGQQVVSRSMKSRQLAFSVGDYYSYSNIQSSSDNMLSLGTFELVKIDTSSIFEQQSDSTLSFIVFTQYKKQQEYGFSAFLNRTAIDNLVNLGAELSYFHRNIFGAAQSINPFARVTINDISRSLSNFTQVEFEYQFGINFAQPFLTSFERARTGLSFQFLWSLRTLDEYLRINTISLPIRFPTTLPRWTYFNSMELNLTLERQSPQNLDEAIVQSLSKAKTLKDSLNIMGVYSLYSNLTEHIENKSPWLTADIFGFSIFGDTRDNPFTPTKGYFSALNLDGWNVFFYPVELLLDASGLKNKIMGAAKYFRVQLANYWFWSLNSQSVLALKQREGLIYWFDKRNSYIPFERQFFAGGANSVRGWQSRKLRYTKGVNLGLENDEVTYNFISDYVGSNTLIEGSLEYRYTFPKPSSIDPTIAEQIANIGITAFLDWGNSFGWLVLDEQGEYISKNKWFEYVTGLALAGGFGLRYNTPIGPIRLDFAIPLYDPSAREGKTIFTKKNALSSVVFHIGLGNAF
ncbi:MAG: BamA/TamA family outer membrane protein [Ignavibacteria bacterium]|nr:BamA/TamA family outer membrane protein [Ignavibacteria bacterium]